jgi:hypothetical protein
MKYCFLFLFFSLLTFHAIAQSNVWEHVHEPQKKIKNKAEKEKSVIKKWQEHIQQWGADTNYRYKIEMGGKLNTNGWSGCINYLKRNNSKENTLWQLSFSEIKHEKQIKQKHSNNYPKLGNATPYVYGKINNLYTLQMGVAKELLLLPSVVEGNTSINLRYSGGLSVAMLKPYYLKLVYVDYNPDEVDYIKQEAYNNDNADKFLNTSYIAGASEWSRGLDKIQYIPGLYGELAIIMVPTDKKVLTQTISMGINTAIYTQSLTIMADQKAYPWQVSLYIGIALGYGY